MKVLLIDPGDRYLEKDIKVVKPYPHIGLCYLGTYLLSKDIETKIIDIGAYELNEKQVEEEIRSFKPDLIGITGMTFLIPEITELCKKIKQINKDIVIVLGGAHASAVPELILEECADIDITIRGEGEEVLYNVVKAFEKGNLKENLRSIRGINFRYENDIISNPKQNYIENLDNIPFPDWSLYDYDKYFKLYSERFNEKLSMYQISGSRGCPYTCAFCYPLLGRQIRYRT
ncbi:MAG: cobalamin-dependent protein, partial [Lutisporaceae bacterium]